MGVHKHSPVPTPAPETRHGGRSVDRTKALRTLACLAFPSRPRRLPATVPRPEEERVSMVLYESVVLLANPSNPRQPDRSDATQ